MTIRERQILNWIEENPMISQEELARKAGITRSAVAVHISNLMKKGHIAGRGYVVSGSAYVAVVGGVNIDIGGRPKRPLIERDSNPGKVSISLGGVGRNIAHNMSLLGLHVRFLTAFGDDLHAQRIEASCADLGIDISHARKVAEASTSTYLYLNDENGDMVLAVSDMEICRQMTPAWLEACGDVIESASVVVADTNIPQETLCDLASRCTCPLFCDPVSGAKASKILPVAEHIHTLKPNRLEAELLTGIRIRTRAGAEKAARELLSMGIRRVFLSMGEEGVCAASQEEILWMPPVPGRMVRTTGCGDAFMAALVWSFRQGASLKESARAGLAAASVTMESTETVSPDLSEDTLKSRMNAV